MTLALLRIPTQQPPKKSSGSIYTYTRRTIENCT